MKDKGLGASAICVVTLLVIGSVLFTPGAFAQEMTRLSVEDLSEMMNRVVARALANGGQYADVYLEEKLVTGITLVDGTVESVEYGIFRGGGVRVISDWKTGYS